MNSAERQALRALISTVMDGLKEFDRTLAGIDRAEVMERKAAERIPEPPKLTGAVAARPLALLSWRQLKDAGWPYSRTHTRRLIALGRFAAPQKLHPGIGGRVVWRWSDVRPHFEPHLMEGSQ